MFKRIISNTSKQVKRSGWVAWSSVAVMTLAFFIATIFAGIAYLSSMYIQFIETRDNVIVFFEVGTEQSLIDKMRNQWAQMPEIKDISFTTEEQAYKDYLEETEFTSPIEHAYLLQRPEGERKLWSSLDISLHSLESLDKVRNVIKDDILVELNQMGYVYDGNSIPPIDLKTDDTSLNEFKEVFSYLRVGGAIVLSLLFVVIFFFTLMTVEFRTYNRMEEIGVMQLVGGSLGYIRAPYVLEGAFYGVMGALLSSAIIFGIVFSLILADPHSTFSIFVHQRLGVLELPRINALGWILILGIKLMAGFLLGAVSSFIAIRKYIK